MTRLGYDLLRALSPEAIDRVVSRPRRPSFARSPGGIPETHVVAPPHLELPENAEPFYVRGFIPTLAAALTIVVQVPLTVPTGMVARISFIEQELTNFSPGVLEDFVEWRLLRDNVGLAPFDLFVGILSRRDLPKRRLVTDAAKTGELVTLRARVLPTAEGGLDAGTVSAWGAIAGWFEPETQTA